MRILVKVLVLIVLTLALLATGFAAGYPIGKHRGIETGAEWALLQAKLAAREAGVVMPVYFEDGLFHVVIRPVPEDCKEKDVRTVQDDDRNNAELVVLEEDAAVTAAFGPAAPDAGQDGSRSDLLHHADLGSL